MKLEVDRAFWAEVTTIIVRYEGEREGLGDEFLDAVDAALALIVERPGAWTIWPGIKQTSPPIQRYVMDRFPYAIGYQVIGEILAVTVIAHAKRRPGYWR